MGYTPILASPTEVIILELLNVYFVSIFAGEALIAVVFLPYRESTFPFLISFLFIEFVSVVSSLHHNI